MTPLSSSRGQMVREASLTEADLAEIAKCRRDQNRLGFAYQVGFVRLFSRFSGSAAPGGLRRAAELRRHATEH